MAAALHALRCSILKTNSQLLNCLHHSAVRCATSTSASQNLLKPVDLKSQCLTVRHSYTFLSRLTAEQLWKGVTSVSIAGRKKGRAKGLKKRIKDLNRGQVIGFGEKNMLWPGLNCPIIRGKEVVQQQQLPEDETRKQRLIEMRDQGRSMKRLKLSPLERGWSGTKLPGRSLGPPDPVADETFEGFDSRVLQFKTIFKMTGIRGRVRTMRAFVVVGNKKGLAGYGYASSLNGMSAANCAKNRAAKALRYFLLEDNRTVLHDFCTTFGSVTIFVKKKPQGYGLVCHRALKSICEIVGIKDMYAKVEGASHNVINITKAFYIGLMKQKTLQQLADEKRLHLVELRKDRDNYPVVVASPQKCRTKDEIGIHEILDFTINCHEGRVQAPVKKFEPFYVKFPSYLKKLEREHRWRNERQIRIQIMARHDGYNSFLTERAQQKAKEKVNEAIEGN